VIARLLKLKREFPAHFLMGNHERALLEFLEAPESYRKWCEFGAVETLLSYGVRPPLADRPEEMVGARDRFARALPAEHRTFLHKLNLSLEIGGYFFAHAGVRPGTPLEQQEPNDLLWIRDQFLTSTEDFGKIVVHGHTPTATAVKTVNRIGIDTGAYATGRLTTAVLEGTDCRFLQTS
jgi:serine/threonine protein phosphatase 1